MEATDAIEIARELVKKRVEGATVTDIFNEVYNLNLTEAQNTTLIVQLINMLEGYDASTRMNIAFYKDQDLKEMQHKSRCTWIL